MKGTWDSIHVVEVQDHQKNAHYKLTSTVMLNIETETAATGQVSLAGSLTRQVNNSTLYIYTNPLPQEERDAPVSDANPHVSNIGKMVEEMENKLRTTLEQIYFGKTKDIVNELRSTTSTATLNMRKQLQQQIGTSLGKAH
jgi:capping protein beta